METDLKASRDTALLLIGFAGAFRRSELCRLSFSDIEWLERGILINLNRSKTDREGFGRTIAIPNGKTEWCPVTALRAWTSRASIIEGPLFRPIEGKSRISRKTLSGEAISILIKKRVAVAELDPKNFSGHSLRSGFATSASRANVATWKILEQTGHQSDQMLTRYIRCMPTFYENPNCKLL